MARFLSPFARRIAAPAVCQRCNFKFYLVDLQPDGDNPGIRVCRQCCDQIDPYKLPPPPPDRIAIPNPLPDVMPVPPQPSPAGTDGLGVASSPISDKPVSEGS